MVERDVGYRAHAALPDVGRVEPAADAHLDDADLTLTRAKYRNAAAVSTSNSVDGPMPPLTSASVGVDDLGRAAR